MRKLEHFTPLLAGFGIGVVASVLLAPEAGGKTRSRIGNMAKRASDAWKGRAADLGEAAGSALQKQEKNLRDEQNEGIQTMKELKRKAEAKIDDASEAARDIADNVVHSSKEVVHVVGEKMESGGNRLQNV